MNNSYDDISNEKIYKMFENKVEAYKKIKNKTLQKVSLSACAVAILTITILGTSIYNKIPSIFSSTKLSNVNNNTNSVAYGNKTENLLTVYAGELNENNYISTNNSTSISSGKVSSRCEIASNDNENYYLVRVLPIYCDGNNISKITYSLKGNERLTRFSVMHFFTYGHSEQERKKYISEHRNDTSVNTPFLGVYDLKTEKYNTSGLDAYAEPLPNLVYECSLEEAKESHFEFLFKLDNDFDFKNMYKEKILSDEYAEMLNECYNDLTMTITATYTDGTTESIDFGFAGTEKTGHLEDLFYIYKK